VSRLNQLSALALACGAVFAAQAADPAVADRVMGGGLRQLVSESEVADARLPAHLAAYLHNERGDVLVRVRLKDGVDAHGAQPALAASGLKVTAISRIDPRHVEGYVSLRDARRLAGSDAVRSVFAERRPMKFAGSVQSQAVALEKADKVQAKGIDGTGIRIGALSDSYDACGLCRHAAMDVESGDLPDDVVVLEDLARGEGTDEGRAMLQLIYDIAPGSKLGFATAFNGLVGFSNNILALREDFGADVITDDVMYGDEPMFSDGLLAKTVDKVSSQGAAYYSSAGNNGIEAYEADFSPISWSEATAAEAAGLVNLKFEQIPAAVRPASVHLFSGSTTKGNRMALSNIVTVAGDARFDFQWDEPFDVDKVKTDYNLYIFDAKGNWIDPRKSDLVNTTGDDNLQTDEPLEYAELMADPGHVVGDIAQSDYQIVIGKMNNGPAEHFKIVTVNSLGVSRYQAAPAIWGHTAARGGQSVAATYYAIPVFPEDFSAGGPVTILFDAKGNRLPKPEIRAVPQITAADGVDNTFFGDDRDANGSPNFFGTSAAAPDAAAVAALVLQAAGGSGSLAPADVYSVIQQTARPIPLPNKRDSAHATAGPVKFQVHGDWTRWSNYFELLLDKGTHGNVAKVELDSTGTHNLLFNTVTTRFYLGDSHGVKREDITYSVKDGGHKSVMEFAPGSFKPGEHFHFGNSVYDPSQLQTQEDADRMRGMTVKVTMEDGTTYKGTVEAQEPMAINRFTGAGLVDAKAAVGAVMKED
jgi:hypothetical protein